jgi:hypothetical protein
VTRWAIAEPETRELPIGYLGAATGAAAALCAAIAVGGAVQSVVSLGGRPDLAAGDLARVTAAALLLAGGRDLEALERAREAARLLQGPHQMIIVEGAGRLFAEPGTLETAAWLAAEWFTEHLTVTAEPLAASTNGRTKQVTDARRAPVRDL